MISLQTICHSENKENKLIDHLQHFEQDNTMKIFSIRIYTHKSQGYNTLGVIDL